MPAEANAALIATAPDLLERCEELVRYGEIIERWLAKGNDEPMWYEDFMREIEAARAAIAKAKGE